MKKTLINFVNLFLASMILVGCDCCTDDPRIDIDYTLLCSTDLLEYATPQITYTKSGKDPITIPIAENEWEEVKDQDVTSEKTIITIKGETITKDSKLVKWKKHVHYDDFSIVDDVIDVTYKPKETAKDVIVIFAAFTHSLSANLVFVDKDGNRITPNDNYNNNIITINIGQSMYLEELINSYKDRMGFHVENNGKYSQIE